MGERKEPFDRVQTLIRKKGFFKSLVDNAQVGVIVCDHDGYIVYMNDTYCRFLDMDPASEIGKHASEIGDLPLEMQPKLLRVLEEKEIEKVGSTKAIKLDFRLLGIHRSLLYKKMKKTQSSPSRARHARQNATCLTMRPVAVPILRHFSSLAAQETFRHNVRISS